MRQRTGPTATIALTLLTIGATTAYAQPELARFVLPGGGGSMSQGTTRSVVALGQPFIMQTATGPVKLELGFYPEGDCVADFNADDQLNFFDVSLFIAAFNAMDPSADLTGDGMFNFFDVSAYIAAFSSGCP